MLTTVVDARGQSWTPGWPRRVVWPAHAVCGGLAWTETFSRKSDGHLLAKDLQIELTASLTPCCMGNRRVISYVLGSGPKLCWQQDRLSVQLGQVGVAPELWRDLD